MKKIIYLLLFCLLFVSCEKKEEIKCFGCSDNKAINFNPLAKGTSNNCKYIAYIDFEFSESLKNYIFENNVEYLNLIIFYGRDVYDTVLINTDTYILRLGNQTKRNFEYRLFYEDDFYYISEKTEIKANETKKIILNYE